MSAFLDLPLMHGGHDSLLRPGPKFRRLPAVERRRLSSVFLEMFDRLLKAHKAAPAPLSPLRDRIAWASVGEDLACGVRVWGSEFRRSARRANNLSRLGAGRSPAVMGQGWPVLDPAGRAGCESSQGAKSPFTPTAVGSLQENLT